MKFFNLCDIIRFAVPTELATTTLCPPFVLPVPPPCSLDYTSFPLSLNAFPVGAAGAWNALPARVRSAPSLSIVRRQLKTHLFCVSFPEQSN